MSQGFDITAEDLKQAEKVFRRECGFVAGADKWEIMPPADLPEIAFAGRSNVGKSSLINALTGRNGLARASNTPGRTQQINFFELDGALRLVDLPGYGYAKASKEKIYAWNDLIERYLATRETLMRVCVLIDSRHGIMKADNETMRLLDSFGTPYVAVLTKTDKVKELALPYTIKDVEEGLKSYKCAYPRVYVSSSVEKGTLNELRAAILMMAGT